jgi:hypothetical protein
MLGMQVENTSRLGRWIWLALAILIAGGVRRYGLYPGFRAKKRFAQASAIYKEAAISGAILTVGISETVTGHHRLSDDPIPGIRRCGGRLMSRQASGRKREISSSVWIPM